MFDRLSEHRADAFRPQLEAVLYAYRKVDPELSSAKYTGVATRAVDLALHGREGYARSGDRPGFGPGRNVEAFFLERAAWKELTQPRKPLPPHTNPSVQWLVQGGEGEGEGELERVGDWSKLTFQGSKEEAQRCFVGEWGRAGTGHLAGLLADLFARSLVKDDALRITRRGVARFVRRLRAIVDDAETPPKLKKAAKALLAAAAAS